MARPPSKHGLEKKFKSWRKGKSKNSKSSSSSSLKQQLRGHERLLLKIPESETERRKVLEEKIAAAKLEIAGKEQTTKERDNATKSHGIRFLERQRLVRLEKKAKDASTKYKIALDMVYVAHFPHDIKYLPLFRKGGERCIDNGKSLFRRSTTRNRIFKQLHKGETKRVDWISAENYKLIVPEWTTQMERDTFGTRTKEDANSGTATTSVADATKASVDNRFAMSAQHEQVLQAAENIENELNEKEEIVKEDDASSVGNDSSDDDDDDADAMAQPKGSGVEKPKIESKNEPSTKDDDSSSSDSSSSSSDSSDSSSDDDSEDEAPISKDNKKRAHEDTNDDEEEDDFFVSATDKNVFEKAKMEKASDLVRSGDKSSGWATQRQRPGKWQPKKQRR